MNWTLRHGDARAEVAALAPGSIDAVVTDPPYGLNFMSKKWDTGEVAFDPAFWALVLAAMKPGAHLVAFGGSRTYHRMAAAIEDAGFEIRDQIMWLYGSGFPKSHNVSKAIDLAAGAEREVVGMLPDIVGELLGHLTEDLGSKYTGLETLLKLYRWKVRVRL